MGTNHTNRERRCGDTLLPDNLKEILNEAQQQALSGIEYSGWEPRFLRRPLFQEPVLVLHNPNDGRMGILDRDGCIKIQPDLKVSDRGMQDHTPSSNTPLIWTK